MKQFMIKLALRMILKWILESNQGVNGTVDAARHTRELGDNMFSRKGAVYRYVKHTVKGEVPVYLMNLAAEAAITLDEIQAKA